MKKLGGLFAKKEDIKPKLLSFREFCQYVYEPSQKLKALNLPDKEEHELRQIIQKRRER
jgi:hypothetical protein